MFKATGTGTYLKVRQRRNGILYPLPCPPLQKKKGKKVEAELISLLTVSIPEHFPESTDGHTQ